jgi:hypothetical protein
MTSNFSGDSLEVGAIAGGVAGGVVGILFLVLVFWCCRRQRKKDEATPATPATPSALEGARPQPVVRGSSTKRKRTSLASSPTEPTTYFC